MTCASCGHENPGGGAFCMRCGAPLQQTMQSAPAAYPPPYAAAADAGPSLYAPPDYGGFWPRFFASLLDGIIVGVVSMVIFIPVGLVIGLAGVLRAGSDGVGDFSFLQGPLVALNYVISMSLQWLYEALLTSSSKQATLGKMALGLVVTDLNGNRISFMRATGRHFGKYVSTAILLIGYLMQPFTEKRQALHDILAGTLVVKRS